MAPSRPRRPLLAIVIACALVLASCSSSDDGDAAPDATTTAPDATTTTTDTDTDTDSETADTATAADEVPGTEWRVEDPADHGIEAATLEQIRAYAFAEGRNTQGLVVIHRGAIVGEWYAEGADATSWAASWSVGKSFASATVGIAIEEGLIPGVDEPMTTWYPDWAERGLGDVTLEDVLQMAPGLDWDENYDPNGGLSDIIQMVVNEGDQLAYAESRPRDGAPGEEFNYSSGTSMLLSGVLEQATGMPADEYAREKLLEPIGMTKVDWWRDTEGHTLTYCCVDTTSRDFARLGLLYLHGGRWGDEQVVPEAWVDASVTGAPASPDLYGLQWWLDEPEGVPEDHFAALGHDGQYIHVIPSLDLVVVRNGTYVKDPGPPVATPNLFTVYPSDGFVPGKGTLPPNEWDEGEILVPLAEDLAD